MTKIARNAASYSGWLLAAVSAALVAGCGGPYAWNSYLSSGYYRGNESAFPTLAVPAEVTGTAGDVSTDELRSVVAEQLRVPATARAATAAPQEGSSTQDTSPTRIAWTFSGTPAPGGAETNVHAVARYYSNNALISAAEGNAVITNGKSDPRLGELVRAVASQLFPTTPRGGPGRG
jgi:hypothetical protein